MPKRSCESCGEKISTRAKRCRHCGEKVKPPASVARTVVTVIGLLILILLLSKPMMQGIRAFMDS